MFNTSISDGGNRSGIICDITDGVIGGEDIPLQMVPSVVKIYLTDGATGGADFYTLQIVGSGVDFYTLQ